MTKVILAKSSNVIGFFVILVLLSLIAFGPYFNFQSIVLFGFIPGLFLIALRNDLETLHIGNREIVIYAILISFTIITIFQDINYESFILAFNGIISGLVASYIPIGLNKNKDYETFFHVGFILSIIALFIIEYSLGNFSLTGFASAKASRGRFFYNANYYSYISYFANFSLFYLHIKYRTLFTSVLLLILPVFFVIMSFITQSRSGLFFILVLNGIFWFLIFKNNKANIYYKIFQKLLLISLAVFSIIKFIDTYQNSQIKGRVAHTADDYRKVLAYEALDVFASHPIIGVGLGQFPEYSRSGLFSHNSYTEILAEQGIIGGILLLLLFVNPTVISFKNLRRNNKDPILRLNFMFFTSFLLYNNAYVFYKVSFAMIYFFLIVSIQNKANIKKMKN